MIEWFCKLNLQCIIVLYRNVFYNHSYPYSIPYLNSFHSVPTIHMHYVRFWGPVFKIDVVLKYITYHEAKVQGCIWHKKYRFTICHISPHLQVVYDVRSSKFVTSMPYDVGLWPMLIFYQLSYLFASLTVSRILLLLQIRIKSYETFFLILCAVLLNNFFESK